MKIFKINIFYIKFLQSLEPKVMWPKEYFFTRPYVGVLLNIGSCKFFGPLSTNKQNKHAWSIINLGRVTGAIFLANMIPVPNDMEFDIVSEVDIDKFFLSEDKEEAAYGLKLFGQSEILADKSLSDELIKKSARIYKLQPYNLFYNKICCNFRFLQLESLKWKISFWYLLYLANEYANKFKIFIDLSHQLSNRSFNNMPLRQ